MVVCGDSKEDLKVRMDCFVEVCKRKCLKVDADKSKVTLFNEKKGLECEMDAVAACVRI